MPEPRIGGPGGPGGTAFHEAGHAVVAHYLGIGVRKVTIVEDDDALGRTLGFGRPMSDDQLYSPDARTRARLEKAIIAAWAGPLAEERATGEFDDHGAGLTSPIHHPEHGQVRRLTEGGDMHRIIEMADTMHGSGRTTDAYIEYLRLRTLDLLEHGPFIWDQIEAVAAALEEHKTLTARQFRDVCQRAVDDALEPGRQRIHGLMAAR
jgi:hypothetical protein